MFARARASYLTVLSMLLLVASLLAVGPVGADPTIPPPDEIDLDVLRLIREAPDPQNHASFNCKARVFNRPGAGASASRINFVYWAETTCTQVSSDDPWTTVQIIEDVRLLHETSEVDSVPDVICPPSGSTSLLPCSTTSTETGTYTCDSECDGDWFVKSRHEVFIGNWIAGSLWHVESQYGKCTFEGQAPEYQTAHIICNLSAKYHQS